MTTTVRMSALPFIQGAHGGINANIDELPFCRSETRPYAASQAVMRNDSQGDAVSETRRNGPLKLHQARPQFEDVNLPERI